MQGCSITGPEDIGLSENGNSIHTSSDVPYLHAVTLDSIDPYHSGIGLF